VCAPNAVWHRKKCRDRRQLDARVTDRTWKKHCGLKTRFGRITRAYSNLATQVGWLVEPGIMVACTPAYADVWLDMHKNPDAQT